MSFFYCLANISAFIGLAEATRVYDICLHTQSNMFNGGLG